MTARVKPVPEPPDDPGRVAALAAAVPLVPGRTDDCCARLRERGGLGSRAAARDWLAFLRGLGLVARTDAGHRRLERDPDASREALRTALLDGVFAARETLDALRAADGPLDADAAFDRVRDRVPTWERHRRGDDWEGRWRDRTRRLLGWFVSLGLAERTADGYVPADAAAGAGDRAAGRRTGTEPRANGDGREATEEIGDTHRATEP